MKINSYFNCRVSTAVLYSNAFPEIKEVLKICTIELNKFCYNILCLKVTLSMQPPHLLDKGLRSRIETSTVSQT